MIVSTISEKVDKSDADSISSVTVKDEPGMTLSRAYSVTSEPPVSINRKLFLRSLLFCVTFLLKFPHTTANVTELGLQETDQFFGPYCPADSCHCCGCCPYPRDGHHRRRLLANKTQQCSSSGGCSGQLDRDERESSFLFSTTLFDFSKEGRSWVLETVFPLFFFCFSLDLVIDCQSRLKVKHPLRGRR